MTPKPTSPVTSTRAGEEMIQANSIASEKVCDHPSTEMAALEKAERDLFQAADVAYFTTSVRMKHVYGARHKDKVR